MKTYAVVDIGTNSARLMIADADEKNTQTKMKTLRMIRMGEGMTKNRRIADAAMVRARDALNEFKQISHDNSANEFFCFATSAVREAQNREDFVCYIREQCSIEVDIISGKDEALLGFSGCISGFGGMFDIGGGSTEIMVGTKDDVRFQQSLKIGTVRSLQLFPSADNADQAAYQRAHALAANSFKDIPRAQGFDYTGIGGTATALAAIGLGLAQYSAKAVQDHEISLMSAQTLCDMLKSKTNQQRKEIIGLEDKRADVIVFGAIITLEFMRATKSDKIIVSDRDNQEGYLMMKLGH